MICTPGGQDPVGQLGGQPLGDLVRVVAQRQLAAAPAVVGVAGRDVPDGGLGLDSDEMRVVVHGSKTAFAVSLTCQTTTAAISIGLPSASLTLAWADSWLRIRVETAIRRVNGFTHCRPDSRIVPRYLPNSWMTRARPGVTGVRPASTRMAQPAPGCRPTPGRSRCRRAMTRQPEHHDPGDQHDEAQRQHAQPRECPSFALGYGCTPGDRRDRVPAGACDRYVRSHPTHLHLT